MREFYSKTGTSLVHVGRSADRALLLRKPDSPPRLGLAVNVPAREISGVCIPIP